MTLVTKASRRIVLPIDRQHYHEVVQYPELFPDEMNEGYTLHDVRTSRKLPELHIRRIRVNQSGAVYRVTPSFVLPYRMGYTDAVEKALFLRRFGVPFWGLTYGFGRSDLYWYRVVEHLGRFDGVGTTVKSPDRLPEHRLADEKFTALNGQEIFVATTVGNEVVLGAATSLTPQTDPLEVAYGEFKREALRLNPTYQPQTLNLDGWRQTKEAWLALFPALVVIRCFLHAFLRIRERCKHYAIYPRLHYLIWRIYQAHSQSSYYRNFNDFLVFAQAHLKGEALKAVQRFKQKRAELLKGLFHPGCHRVSTMLERHMQPMTRCLYMARDFHGHRTSAHLLVRSWALLHNFSPYCPRARLRSGLPFTSPFQRLNGTCYRTCWLENLLVASSGQVEYYHHIR